MVIILKQGFLNSILVTDYAENAAQDEEFSKEEEAVHSEGPKGEESEESEARTPGRRQTPPECVGIGRVVPAPLSGTFPRGGDRNRFVLPVRDYLMLAPQATGER